MEDIEKKLETLEVPTIEMPTHKANLRRALLSADTEPEISPLRGFFKSAFLKSLYVSAMVLMFVGGIFVGINLNQAEEEQTPIFSNLESMIANADEAIETKLAEEKDFYYLLTKVNELSEIPYEYELDYYRENWINLGNFDEYEALKGPENNEVLYEEKSIDGRYYKCTDCKSRSELISDQTQDQPFPETYETYSSRFFELDSEGKLSDYNSRAVNTLQRLIQPNTLDERKQILEDLNNIDDIEFINDATFSNIQTYQIGYSYDYEDELSLDVYVYFDIEDINLVGHETREEVKGEIFSHVTVEIIDETFVDESFDLSTEGFELSFESDNDSGDGQLDIPTDIVRQETNYYDEFYDDFEDFVTDWTRFRDDDLDISFNLPPPWTLSRIPRTDERESIEYQSRLAGFYLRVENSENNYELEGENVGSLRIGNSEINIVKENFDQEEPFNFEGISEFSALEVTFVKDGKTYVIAKILNPEDNEEKAIQVFREILGSVRFE